MEMMVECDFIMNDFYNFYDLLDVILEDKEVYECYISKLLLDEKVFLDVGYYYYFVEFDNFGGLVMLIIFEF